MPKRDDFAAWLDDALAGRKNVFLVRGSGLKDNGRPVIDDSRVSKWLKGEQRPSVPLAALAARVLGRDPGEALAAAGYADIVMDGSMPVWREPVEGGVGYIDYPVPAGDRIWVHHPNGRAALPQEDEDFVEAVRAVLRDRPEELERLFSTVVELAKGGDGHDADELADRRAPSMNDDQDIDEAIAALEDQDNPPGAPEE